VCVCVCVCVCGSDMFLGCASDVCVCVRVCVGQICSWDVRVMFVVFVYVRYVLCPIFVLGTVCCIGCGVGVERLSVPICQCGYCVNICVVVYVPVVVCSCVICCVCVSMVVHQ